MYLHGEGAEAQIEKNEPVLTEQQLELAEFLIARLTDLRNLGCGSPPESGTIDGPIWPGMSAEESEIFGDFRIRLSETEVPVGIFAENYVIDLTTLNEKLLSKQSGITGEL